MRVEEYYWISGDGTKLFARSWFAEKPSGKVILLIHGLGDHCSRYERWVRLFNHEGHSVLSFDQRGHGRSEGKRGHTRSLELLMDDINLLFEKSDEIFPGLKKILYGHSMGGSLAINFIIHRNRPVSGLIVTSPWLKLFKQPDTPTIIFSKIMNKLIPSSTFSTRIKPEQISHDPEFISNYFNDPLIHDRISVRMFYELYSSGLFALRNVFKINCPFLLMHGSGDTITSPKASENYMLNTNTKITFRLWENQFHALHNELIYKEIFFFIRDWIKSNT